ncbi:cytochrome-c peroxidase [Pseudoprimorskyibacter insulae]|nr:cytochrome c peroxidase [Pseudoprimorskyibacter insulae]
MANIANLWRLAASLTVATAMPVVGQTQPDLGPRPVFNTPHADRAALGQLLFYDPILSGNKSVSCATCHHPRFGTADGLSLGIGDGGIGLGPDRKPDPANLPEQRIPRNAPALWNLGAIEFTTFFHDGRLQDDPSQPHGVRTPLGADMAEGFDSALAAQAMFPVLSPDEMAGHYAENDISKTVRLGLLSQPGGAWDQLAARVSEIPEYRAKFDAVNGPGSPITFPEIGNLIADFIRVEWRADNSAFDRYMAGGSSLTDAQTLGMELFYGEAGCAACHSGWLQTDHDFHALALPQIGPGKAARFENHHRDDGRLRVTGAAADAFAFRTPSLRNVTLTAPYGHDGAFADLGAMIRQHMDPVASLQGYQLSSAVLPDLSTAKDDLILQSPQDMAALADVARPVTPMLSSGQIDAIIAFLHALEDPAERLGIPDRVPSGLPVDR